MKIADIAGWVNRLRNSTTGRSHPENNNVTEYRFFPNDQVVQRHHHRAFGADLKNLSHEQIVALLDDKSDWKGCRSVSGNHYRELVEDVSKALPEGALENGRIVSLLLPEDAHKRPFIILRNMNTQEYRAVPASDAYRLKLASGIKEGNSR